MRIDNLSLKNNNVKEHPDCKGRKMTICLAEFVECKTETTNCFWGIPFGMKRLCRHANAMSFIQYPDTSDDSLLNKQ